jgi:hypothetical protein
MQVRNLPPGAMVESPVGAAIFLTSVRHPLWKNLKLVIWWVINERRWSFDALSPEQEVGTVRDQLPEERQKNLQRILIGNEC